MVAGGTLRLVERPRIREGFWTGLDVLSRCANTCRTARHLAQPLIVHHRDRAVHGVDGGDLGGSVFQSDRRKLKLQASDDV